MKQGKTINRIKWRYGVGSARVNSTASCVKSTGFAAFRFNP